MRNFISMYSECFLLFFFELEFEIRCIRMNLIRNAPRVALLFEIHFKRLTAVHTIPEGAFIALQKNVHEFFKRQRINSVAFFHLLLIAFLFRFVKKKSYVTRAFLFTYFFFFIASQLIRRMGKMYSAIFFLLFLTCFFFFLLNSLMYRVSFSSPVYKFCETRHSIFSSASFFRILRLFSFLCLAATKTKQREHDFVQFCFIIFALIIFHRRFSR